MTAGRTHGEGSVSRPCRRGRCSYCQGGDCECNCHIPVPGHVREAMAIGESLDPPQPGVLLGDCSCGVTYTAVRAPDGDEYGPLEAAHAAHAAHVKEADR